MHVIPIQGLNALAWSMTAADVLLTAGRFAIKWRKTQRIRFDDILNAAALFFMIGFFVTYQLYMPIEYNAELYGLGLSDHAPTHRDVAKDMRIQIANMLLFWLVIYLVKASFLALYWQIFSISTKFRVVWGAGAVFTALSFVVTWAFVFCHCGAAQDFLNEEACANRPRALVLTFVPLWCVLNVLGDLFLMALPLAMLRPMQMPGSQKLGLALVFSLVAIEIAFDITRTVYTMSLNLSNFPDQNTVWCILEQSIAVMVCALPCYRGLIWRKSPPSSHTVETYDSSKIPDLYICSDSDTSISKTVSSDASNATVA